MKMRYNMKEIKNLNELEEILSNNEEIVVKKMKKFKL